MSGAFSRDALQNEGFVGFETVRILRSSFCIDVPETAGVYVVLAPDGTHEWLPESPGGRFKGKDPTVPLRTLAENWVDGAPVLYIGKANDLRRRVRAFVDFGGGRPVAHWGGRLIWQIERADELVFAWAEAANPLRAEGSLLKRFINAFGALPYANLRL